MELIPKGLEIPNIGETSEEKRPVALVKLFCPWNNWTWYIVEYDPIEEICYGIADGFVKEMGSFSLDEIRTINGPLELKIERDIHWEPKSIYEIMEWD